VSYTLLSSDAVACETLLRSMLQVPWQLCKANHKIFQRVAACERRSGVLFYGRGSGVQGLADAKRTCRDPFLTGAAIIILEILAVRAVLQPRQPTFDKTAARPN
jgi:hypothetical protein